MDVGLESLEADQIFSEGVASVKVGGIPLPGLDKDHSGFLAQARVETSSHTTFNDLEAPFTNRSMPLK